jgi:hypothetical protein
MVVTFLPYPDIRLSITCLDRTRISKQKLEAFQMLNVVEGRKEGYRNHPAVKMWMGYAPLLKHYLNECIDECERRGYSNSIERIEDVGDIVYPWWWGWEHLHRSHQASLIRKHPLYYTPIFTDIDPLYLGRGYVWPSRFDETALSITDDSIYAPINKDGMKSAQRSKELLYTMPDLRKMCREKGIRGYSKLKKADLMSLLGL